MKISGGKSIFLQREQQIKRLSWEKGGLEEPQGGQSSWSREKGRKEVRDEKTELTRDPNHKRPFQELSFYSAWQGEPLEDF